MTFLTLQALTYVHSMERPEWLGKSVTVAFGIYALATGVTAPIVMVIFISVTNTSGTC